MPAVPFTRICRQLAWGFMKRFINIAARLFPAVMLIALVAIPAAHGAWTEDELRDKFWLLYGIPAVTIYSTTSDSSTTYSSSDPTAVVETQVQLSDIEPAKEYAL